MGIRQVQNALNMKNRQTPLTWFVATAVAVFLPALPALVDAQESESETVRLEAFPQLHERLTRGESITVVFLGGSITMGAKAEAGRSCRELVGDWLTKTYPKAEIRLINRAIGSTGSLLGAFRFEDQVLNEEPDLLFIEFCVNDMGNGPGALEDPHNERSPYRTLSGLVRRARQLNPEMAIVMPITTVRKSAMSDKWTASREVFTRFANLEQIPYVDLYEDCYEKPLPDGLTEDLLFTGEDNPGNAVHPDNGGHQVYAHAINRTLDALLNTGEFTFLTMPEEDYQSFPLEPQLYTPNDFEGTESWTIKKASSRFPAIDGRDVMIATADSQPITLKFKGRPTILWGYSQDGNDKARGVIELHLDGKRVATLSGQAGIQGAKSMGRWTWIYRNVDPEKEHTLTIKVPKDQKEVFMPILGIGVDAGGL